MSGDGKKLGRKEISAVLDEIGRRMEAMGLIAEFAVFGGSAIALTFDFRDSTSDIDFMPISGNMDALSEIAREIGVERGFVDGWFNDAVEIFASDNPEYRLVGEFPLENPGIRVFSASPQYILAMKVMSMRSSMVANDFKDVWHLVDEIGVTTADEVIGIVDGFYPEKRIPRRNELILRDLFDEKDAKRPFNAMTGF
jgi:predicted nucleotidyltransferase component of viral defense system